MGEFGKCLRSITIVIVVVLDVLQLVCLVLIMSGKKSYIKNSSQCHRLFPPQTLPVSGDYSILFFHNVYAFYPDVE